MADDMSFNPTRDDFEALLNDSMGGRDFAEGTVVKGIVVGIEKDFAIIDVGLKTEGRVPQKEFGVDDAGKPTIKVGDHVEVFLERLENALGEAVISREKAKREEAWTRLEGVYAQNVPVMGAIVGRVKGGFTVDLGGASAFLIQIVPLLLLFALTIPLAAVYADRVGTRRTLALSATAIIAYGLVFGPLFGSGSAFTSFATMALGLAAMGLLVASGHYARLLQEAGA